MTSITRVALLCLAFSVPLAFLVYGGTLWLFGYLAFCVAALAVVLILNSMAVETGEPDLLLGTHFQESTERLAAQMNHRSYPRNEREAHEELA